MLLNEGRLEGERKGEIRGELKAKRSILIKILDKKFGPVPQNLQEQISKIEEMAKLDELIDQAISVESITELKF